MATAAASAPAMIAPLRFLKSLLIASRTTGPPWGQNIAGRFAARAAIPAGRLGLRVA